MTTQRDIWLSALELERGATPAEIVEAYRQLVEVWHPDRFAHNPTLQLRAQEKLKRINEAYAALKELAIGNQILETRTHFITVDEGSGRAAEVRARPGKSPTTPWFARKNYGRMGIRCDGRVAQMRRWTEPKYPTTLPLTFRARVAGIGLPDYREIARRSLLLVHEKENAFVDECPHARGSEVGVGGAVVGGVGGALLG